MLHVRGMTVFSVFMFELLEDHGEELLSHL